MLMLLSDAKRSFNGCKSSTGTFSLVNFIFNRSLLMIILLNEDKIKSFWRCHDFKALMISKSSNWENKSKVPVLNVSKVILFCKKNCKGSLHGKTIPFKVSSLARFNILVKINSATKLVLCR